MQDKRGPNVPSRKAAEQGTIASTLDDHARWRIATEVVQTLRDSGYECELHSEKDLH
jgi:hypothetical protein